VRESLVRGTLNSDSLCPRSLTYRSTRCCTSDSSLHPITCQSVKRRPRMCSEFGFAQVQNLKARTARANKTRPDESIDNSKIWNDTCSIIYGTERIAQAARAMRWLTTATGSRSRRQRVKLSTGRRWPAATAKHQSGHHCHMAVWGSVPTPDNFLIFT